MKTLTKSIIGVGAAAVVAAAVVTPVLVTAYGDNTGTEAGRQVYTNAQINEMYKNKTWGDKITFNSITDGAIGDERNFVSAIESANFNPSSKNNAWKDNSIAVEDGQTYTIRMYVHNNSPMGMEGIAKNVTSYFSLPETVSTDLAVTGYLDSSNATPTRVFDEVHFTSNDNFYLKYVNGSASYTNGKGTFKLSDDIIIGAHKNTGGALLGYTSMNGEIPGCYEYSGEVHIQVTAHKSVTADLEKKVRIKGTEEWSTEAINAKVGDEVEYQIGYVNLEDDTVNDVIIRDVLPTNVEYVAGSTELFNSNHQKGAKVQSDDVTTTGINIGNYLSKGKAYVRFTGKIVDKTLACGSNQLVNWANVTTHGSVAALDDVSVMVNKECKEPDNPTPDTPTPDNPTPSNPTPSTPAEETPAEIVSTGAGEIATGAIGAGALVTSAGYYVASRKKLM